MSVDGREPMGRDAAHPLDRTVAAFFDVDNTVIRGASAYHLARELYRRKFFGTGDLLRFGIIQAKYLMFGESKKEIDTVRNRALSLIKGRSVAEVVSVGEEVYDTVLGLRIYPGTKKLIDDHLAAGHQVWFVTASPVEIGRLIAGRLGATGCLGTEAEHEDGFYTGKMLGEMMHGARKAAAIGELAAIAGIDLAASYAYGDSLNDLPM
ncbi:MAG: HAD-IB family hydrolase, partial [Cellulomonadaceae bacterium]|nr:HAD-IB family hydrolase [Cellulomonadaceae bacterium]